MTHAEAACRVRALPLPLAQRPSHTPCFAYSGSAIPAEQNFQSTLLRICGWEPCAKAARNRLRHTRGERNQALASTRCEPALD
jgi:hypothetical protein